MAARWAGLAILATMLAIVGVFLWAVIKPPAPPAPSGTGSAAGLPVGAEKRIAGPAGPWTLYAWALPEADRGVTVTVSARDLEERPIAALASPTATLRMLDMAMAPERAVLVPERPGFWRGSTRREYRKRRRACGLNHHSASRGEED